MSPYEQKRRTVLITGASSGIGYELAKIFAKNGFDLVLVARSELKLVNTALELQQQYSIKAIPLSKDLSEPNAASDLHMLLQSQGIAIDILVNNAGFGAFGPFIQTNWEEEQKMIHVNMTLLTELSKLFGSDMVKRGYGKILNVASTAAFQPGPLMAVYYATKAYVLSFSEALANELQGTGVTVSCLCPGPTDTEFHKRANISPSKLVNSNMRMEAEPVARIGYKGLMRGKRLIIPGMKNKMFVQAVRFLPRQMITAIIRRVQDKRR
jgi:short-subunit dehydrogenase